jgi:hypothetical protein
VSSSTWYNNKNTSKHAYAGQTEYLYTSKSPVGTHRQRYFGPVQLASLTGGVIFRWDDPVDDDDDDDGNKPVWPTLAVGALFRRILGDVPVLLQVLY